MFNKVYFCNINNEAKVYKESSKYNLENYFNLRNEYNIVPSLATKYDPDIFKRGVIPNNFDVKVPIEKDTEFYKYKNEIPNENKLWYHDILAKKDTKSYLPGPNSDMYKLNVKMGNHKTNHPLLFKSNCLSNSNSAPIKPTNYVFNNSTRQERNKI